MSNICLKNEFKYYLSYSILLHILCSGIHNITISVLTTKFMSIFNIKF